MEQFPHKKFLQENQALLAEHILPEPLQERLKGFDELEAELPNTTDIDRQHLLDRLESLSHELDEDLEEYFEEFLDNNELDEEADSQDSPAGAFEKQETPPGEPSTTAVNQQDSIAEAGTRDEQADDTLLPDERILQEFLDAKKIKVLAEELRAKGFKTVLGEKFVEVGRFGLLRRRYDQYYLIIHD